MAPAPDRLYQVARRALTVIQDGFAEAEVNLPDRQYVADGTAVYDCAQLTVQVERTYSHRGNVATETIIEVDCLSMRAATLAITLLRCVPTITASGQPPSADKIEAAAREVLTDAQLIWNCLVKAKQSGALKPYDHGLAFDQWTGVGPDGGLSGGTMRVRWALAAGPPPPGS